MAVRIATSTCREEANWVTNGSRRPKMAAKASVISPSIRCPYPALGSTATDRLASSRSMRASSSAIAAASRPCWTWIRPRRMDLPRMPSGFLAPHDSSPSLYHGTHHATRSDVTVRRFSGSMSHAIEGLAFHWLPRRFDLDGDCRRFPGGSGVVRPSRWWPWGRWSRKRRPRSEPAGNPRPHAGSR